MPRARSHHSAVSINEDQMYIFGGLTQSGWATVALADLWLFKMSSKTWSLLSSSNITIVNSEQEMYQPQPRYGQIMVGSKKHNKLFVIGGCSKKGEPFKEIIQYDITTGQWSLCSMLPKSIVVTCQIDPKIPQDARDIYVSQQNKMVPSCIPARFGSACMFDDFIFITGGETLESGVSPVLDDVLVYNVVTHKLLVSGYRISIDHSRNVIYLLQIRIFHIIRV